MKSQTEKRSLFTREKSKQRKVTGLNKEPSCDNDKGLLYSSE